MDPITIGIGIAVFGAVFGGSYFGAKLKSKNKRKREPWKTAAAVTGKAVTITGVSAIAGGAAVDAGKEIDEFIGKFAEESTKGGFGD